MKLKNELVKRGFEDCGIKTQHDRIFNDDCFKEGVKLRIRVEDDKAEITCKSKTDYSTGLQNRGEVNVEIKTTDVEKHIQLFELMGYSVFFQVLKTRHKFKKEGIEVVFDSWPLIDELIEIEGEKEVIENFVQEVLPHLDRGTYTYKEHLESKMKNTGKTLAELKKEYEEKNNFQLFNVEKILEG